VELDFEDQERTEAAAQVMVERHERGDYD